MFYKQVGEEVFEYLPKLKNIDTESRFLYCRKYAAPSCLDYSKEEVKEIISLIN
jgi:hypothetical protein